MSKNKIEFSRRQFCKLTGATALSCMIPALGAKPNKALLDRIVKKKKPNLLFVFSDQHSRDIMGCYGNRDILTPNLDNFAKEGVKFEHCISSSPVCTPYRGMLMSGQHCLYNGTIDNDVPLLANNGKYFGHVLKDAGYKTGYIGKWHLFGGDRNRPIPAGDMRYGFDEIFLSNNCTVNFNQTDECYYWNENGEKVLFNEWEVYGQTKQAFQFLDECSPESKDPFALFVSWHPPHDDGIHEDSLVYKYNTIPELLNLYDPDKIHLRPSVEDIPHVREAYQGYYGMISGIDTAFGWLMKKLRDKGLDKNTIVVYTSDHGDNLHSYNYAIPKNHPEDTSVRVPLLMRFPDHIQQNSSSQLLVNPMDIMPTILGFMGLNIPGTVQGQDLSSAIINRKDDVVDSVPLFFHNPAWRGVCTRRYTYGFGTVKHFAHGNNGKLTMKSFPIKVLYDRQDDPYQLKNLYGEKSVASLQKEMERLTRKWLDYFEDPGVELSFEELSRIYSYSDGQFPSDTQEPGFKGRPIDVINQFYKSR
ncbi:MAG: sulfatase-like hydrolase/transferase [Ignavibacteria bacterium]|jgi:arylsulfatase A-like enzyme